MNSGAVANQIENDPSHAKNVDYCLGGPAVDSAVETPCESGLIREDRSPSRQLTCVP